MLGLDFVLVVGAFGLIIIAHEVCHMAGYRMFRLPFTVKLKSCAIVVESPYFAGKFKDLPKLKQEQYTLIAMMPYMFLLPILAFLSYYNIVIAGFLMASQIVNMPLEFGLY